MAAPQLVVVDQGTARAVHHECPRPQPGDRLGIEQRARAGDGRDVERQDVGALEHAAEAQPLDAGGPCAGRSRVGADDAAEDRCRQPGQRPPGATHPDDAEGQRRGPPPRARREAVPAAVAHVPVEERQVADEAEDHRQGRRRDLLRRRIGDVRNPGAVRGRRVEIDVVDADGDRGDDGQPVERGEDVRGDGAVAHQQRRGSAG
jgi:hypothetical protein